MTPKNSLKFGVKKWSKIDDKIDAKISFIIDFIMLTMGGS
jgi:hypothetical protein